MSQLGEDMAMINAGGDIRPIVEDDDARFFADLATVYAGGDLSPIVDDDARFPACLANVGFARARLDGAFPVTVRVSPWSPWGDENSVTMGMDYNYERVPVRDDGAQWWLNDAARAARLLAVQIIQPIAAGTQNGAERDDMGRSASEFPEDILKC